MPDDRKHEALAEYLAALRRLQEAKRIHSETMIPIVGDHVDWCLLQARLTYQVCRSAGWSLEDLAMITGAYSIPTSYPRSS